MGKKATSITLSSEDRAFLEEQTRARTIQAQTVVNSFAKSRWHINRCHC